MKHAFGQYFLVSSSKLSVPVALTLKSIINQVGDFKKEYIFFGDSLSDASAAYKYKIDFAYRNYPLNFGIIPKYYNYIFSDFSNEINRSN